MTRNQSNRTVTFGLALVVLTAALAIRLHGLDAKPLWNDEAWSVDISRLAAHGTIRMVQQDYHPPLYYLTLNAWQKLGAGVFWSRLPSALFGSVACLLVFMTGVVLAGPDLGLAAGLVLATAPLQVEWSQAARGYAELNFAVALALLGAARILAFAKPPPIWSWVAYVGGAAMALWIHNLAAFFVLSVNLAALVHWAYALRCNRHFALRWIAAQLTIVALFLPWVPSLLVQIGHLSAAKHFFASTWATYYTDLETVYGVSHLWTLAPVALAVVGGLAACGLVANSLAGGGRRLLAVVVLAPLIISASLFAAGQIFFGVLIGKLVWLGVPYSLAAGAGVLAVVTEARRGRLGLAGAGLLLIAAAAVLQVQGLRNLFASPNPAWDQAAMLTRQQVETGDVVMDDPAEPAHAYNYYCAQLGVDLPHVYPPDGDQSELLRWLTRYHRVWVPVPVPAQDNLLPKAVTVSENAAIGVRRSSYRSVDLYLLSVGDRKDHTP